MRGRGFADGATLDAATERSSGVSNDMPVRIRRISCLVRGDPGGTFGTGCLYRASSAVAIHRHAEAADPPSDEIVRIVDPVVIRPDPK
jgi:hypothetical protein